MIHLELAPELEAHIAAMAEDHALPVESYVQKIVADHVAANESEAADDLRGRPSGNSRRQGTSRPRSLR